MIHYQRVNDLVNGQRGMTPNTALRLAKYFGKTPAFWMNLQLRWDLYFTSKKSSRYWKVFNPTTICWQGIENLD